MLAAKRPGCYLKGTFTPQMTSGTRTNSQDEKQMVFMSSNCSNLRFEQLQLRKKIWYKIVYGPSEGDSVCLHFDCGGYYLLGGVLQQNTSK